MSLVLAGENGTLDDLIAATEHGLLVTRFWYNRVVDPRRTIITGMTRDGTFLIENGKLGGAVRNLRYNVSVLEMLERATHFSRDLEPLVSDWDRACVVAPAIRSTEFRFTGISPS
jgi:predicted Zn-dependent protease